MNTSAKKEIYNELIKVHRQCIEVINTNDFKAFNKLVKEHLKDKRELYRLNKLRLILLASKDSLDERVLQVREKVMEEYIKLVNTLEPKVKHIKIKN